jgi:hypothetical protein
MGGLLGFAALNPTYIRVGWVEQSEAQRKANTNKKASSEAGLFIVRVFIRALWA